MNRIYRLIWRGVQHGWVVAGELARGKTKAATVCAAVALSGAGAATADTVTVDLVDEEMPYVVESSNTGTAGTDTVPDGQASYVFTGAEPGMDVSVNVNDGVNVTGGAGASIKRDDDATGGSGGTGMTGSNLRLTNEGRITGGRGADGTGDVTGTGGRGGDGIAGNNLSLTNTKTGTISGQSGGAGMAYGKGVGSGDVTATGGRGGNGIAGNNLILANEGNITGGMGYGGEGFGRGAGELTVTGGRGGDGIAAHNLSLTNAGSITGGQGGYGYGYGMGYDGRGYDGNVTATGGRGGNGITGHHLSLTNAGNIAGGKGGYGDGSVTGTVTGTGTGGRGGDGIAGDNLSLTNTGVIAGGKGGNGTGYGTTTGGNGGDAIRGSNITVSNAGTLRGGGAGVGETDGVAGASLHLTGGNNALILETGSNITGDIVLDEAGNGGNSLFLHTLDENEAGISGSLRAGSGTSVTLAGDEVSFTGDATLGEGTTLAFTGGGSLSADGDITLSNTALVTDIHRWEGDTVGLVAGRHINGTWSTEQARVAGMTDPDFAFVEKATSDTDGHTADVLRYALRWNAAAEAHGTFTLAAGSRLELGAVLADNDSGAGSGWDGKSLTKEGAGELVLSGRSTYSGHTAVNGGMLTLGVVSAIEHTSGVTVAEGAALNLGGNNQTLKQLENAGSVWINTPGAGALSGEVRVKGDMVNRGSVYLRSCEACAGQTWRQQGDWHGEGGTVYMGVVAGDDGSATDRLVIEGQATGTTRVNITNEGGSGSRTLEGIRVIETGESTAGAFVQEGRVVAGSYEYRLQQGSATGQGMNDWYLTSRVQPGPSPGPSPEPVRVHRPEAGSYTANLSAAASLFNLRLADREGGSAYRDPVTGEAQAGRMWMQTTGGRSEVRLSDGQGRTTANRMVFRLGSDVVWGSTGEKDYWVSGLMVGYGKQDSRTRNGVSGYASRGSVSGYSAGVYGTWYEDAAQGTGWYTDGWLQYGWFDNTVKGEGLTGEKYRSGGLSASVEGGYTFEAGRYATHTGRENAVYVRPQGQVMWSGMKADRHREGNGTRVEGRGEGNVETRLGVRVSVKGEGGHDSGTGREFEPYAEVNWLHNSRHYGVSMDGEVTVERGRRDAGELRLGVEGRAAEGVGLWGNVSQRAGGGGYHDTQGMLGVKVTF